MSSFGLGFYPASEDHHISIFNVTPSIVKGNITVGLQDDDGKETFGYQVMHQVVHDLVSVSRLHQTSAAVDAARCGFGTLD